MTSNIFRHVPLSDLFLISFKTNYTITPTQITLITYRPMKNINYMIFLVDLYSALGDKYYSLVILNSLLSYLLDKHAPSSHSEISWFTSYLIPLK